MTKNIKSVFAEVGKDLVIDKALIRNIHLYAVLFVNKNQDHIAFFGGNLLGVHPIRFKDEDNDRWFDDILNMDEIYLRDEIHNLPTVTPEYRVASNVFFLSCVALTNKIFNSTLLSQTEKEQGMVDVLKIMQYKMITSLMVKYFPYPADQRVAEATYAALNMKFSLKVHGTWDKLIEARARDVISHNSIHHSAIRDMENDAKTCYIVTDCKTRLNDVVKTMRGVFQTILDSKGKFITTTSIGIDMEGASFIKDKSRNYSTYKRYLHEQISERTSFIKIELVQIVSKAMQSMSEQYLVDTLDYMVNHYRYRGDHLVEEILDDVLLHTFDYLSSNKALIGNPNDLAAVTTKLRAVFMSSRSKDPMLLKIRKNIETIVAKSIRSRDETVYASVRTGVMLYLVLRAFTMRHYSK